MPGGRRRSGAAAMQMLGEGAYDAYEINTYDASVTASGLLVHEACGDASNETLTRWYRARLYFWLKETDTNARAQFMLVACKLKSGESISVWATVGWIDQMRRDGKLFLLKPLVLCKRSYSIPKLQTIEFFNVKLREGEKVKIYLQTLDGSSYGAYMNYDGIVEERVVTV